MDIWSTLIAIIGSIGGLEGIRYLLNRNAEKRTANAKADTEVFHSLKEYNEYLQQELRSKEERFAEQTLRVRKLTDEVIDLTEQMGKAKAELCLYRCKRLGCGKRLPPNSFTTPEEESGDAQPETAEEEEDPSEK
ncbi:MAG: hypothetical protein LIP09_11260 [Bacteroidales bacterium]|nr:hypothetical protein [Bacteroidales bacterium]